MKKLCKLPTCGVEFEDTTRNHNKGYCCDQHRRQDSDRLRKEQLKGLTPAVASEATGEKQLAIGLQKQTDSPVHRPSSVQLDPLGTFIKEQLEEKVDELKASIKKKDDLIEKLQGEAKEREKEIAELQKNLEAKPTGLSGFMQNNQSIIEKIAEHAGPELGKGLGSIMTAVSNKINPPFSEHGQRLAEWIDKMPEAARTEIFNMINGIFALPPEQVMSKISEITRSLMAATPNQTTEPQKLISRRA